MRKPIIIARRGASGYAKENTMESFGKAIDLEADMIEFDVRRAKDHVLKVRRKLGGFPPDIPQ